jgi:hypothetical protein
MVGFEHLSQCSRRYWQRLEGNDSRLGKAPSGYQSELPPVCPDVQHHPAGQCTQHVLVLNRCRYTEPPQNPAVCGNAHDRNELSVPFKVSTLIY